MADENMEMKQAPKNLLKRLTYTPVRTSAIFMAGATLWVWAWPPDSWCGG